MTQPISIRLSEDLIHALDAFAALEDLSRPEAAAFILTRFLADQATTSDETRARLAAEARLTEAVVSRADDLRDTDYPPDVMRGLFQWIEAHHLDDYRAAIGSSQAFKQRLNPLLAKRFFNRLGADYAEIRNGLPKRVDVPANSTELIGSYTLLRPK